MTDVRQHHTFIDRSDVHTPIEQIVRVLEEEKKNEVDAIIGLDDFDFSVDSKNVVIVPKGGQFFRTAVKGGDQWPATRQPIYVGQEEKPFSQMWGRLGGSTPSFFPKNKISPDPLAALLQDRKELHHREIKQRGRRGGESLMFRSGSRNGGLWMYAALSDSYSIFDNLQVTLTAQNILNQMDTGYRIPVTPDYFSGRRDYFSLPIIVSGRDTPDGYYAAGISIINGQSGGSSVRVNPFVMRTSCTNSIRYQHDEAMRFVHRFASSATIAIGLVDAMAEAFELSEQIVNRAVEGYAQTLPRTDFQDVVTNFCQKFNFEPLTVISGAEGSYTVTGLSNLITAAARDLRIKHPDQDMKAQELEHIGGRVLMETGDLDGANLARHLFALVTQEPALLEEERY